MLSCVEVLTGEQPTASVIWLHGLGADGHDFEALVPELDLPKELAIRFIFPHAPKIPVTINGGIIMPAWYDILDMSIERKVDAEQLLQSANAVIDLVEQEINKGILSERIILAGFSQGGAVVYEAALSFAKKLGGLLTMSTYLATADTLTLHEVNKTIPMLIQHGTQDPVVPEALGQHAYSFFQNKGFDCHYKRYPMQHSVCQAQINDISQWLRKRLA